MDQEETSNKKTATENMEVHHHPQVHHSKKWKDYLFEFLMLFLAVSGGFLVENMREHYAEHQKEKQFMKSMVEDLKMDIAEINNSSNRIYGLILPQQEKALDLLFLEKIPDSLIKGIYTQVPQANVGISVIIQKRTTEQLKNSGGLRLIQNKEVTDSLANYWYWCDNLQNLLLANYEADRKIAKDLILSLVNYDYYQDKSPYSIPLLLEKKQLRLLSNDPVLFIKLGNRMANMRSSLKGPFRLTVERIKSMATHLITLINKEYHLE